MKLTRDNRGFALVFELLLVAAVLAMATIAVYGANHSRKPVALATASPAPSATPHSTPAVNAPSSSGAAPVAAACTGSELTYTSAQEKLSFQYPCTWSAQKPALSSNVPGGDAYEIRSPSGSVTVSWISAADGLGGACDSNDLPGTAGANGLSPCPYWTVLDKERLASANLYYVAGVVTMDGTTYTPWCALQASDGILSSQSNMGYLLFPGQNNGGAAAGLMCGEPFGSDGLMKGTKAQATAFFSSAEAIQAKQILMSASY